METEKEKAIFKFNSGNFALLCSNCRIIIKVGREFTEEEDKACFGAIDLPPQYCDKCKKQ
jgi:hypothetical protein